jgi:hypothetical protein
VFRFRRVTLWQSWARSQRTLWQLLSPRSLTMTWRTCGGSCTWATNTLVKRPGGAYRNWSHTNAPISNACQEPSAR